MSPMHPMKLPPFTSCQRPQNRMIGNGLSLGESSIALGNDDLHTRDILKNFSAKLRNRGAARKHALRGLPPGREKSQPEYFFFQAEDGIRDYKVTGVQTCTLPI